MKPGCELDSVVNTLKKVYPEAGCSLPHKTDFQLLVAVILSAQTTDKKVAEVLPELFVLAPDPKSMALAPLNKIKKCISTLGLFNAKAKNLKNMAKLLVERFSSQVPPDFKSLLTLPGVGRKTANVIQCECFSTPALVVDTHVLRLSRRLGLVDSENPEIVEKELSRRLSPRHWCLLTHLFIAHGRNTCTARSPKCSHCALKSRCPSAV